VAVTAAHQTPCQNPSGTVCGSSSVSISPESSTSVAAAAATWIISRRPSVRSISWIPQKSTATMRIKRISRTNAIEAGSSGNERTTIARLRRLRRRKADRWGERARSTENSIRKTAQTPQTATCTSGLDWSCSSRIVTGTVATAATNAASPSRRSRRAFSDVRATARSFIAG
jgi:hypothetical protein